MCHVVLYHLLSLDGISLEDDSDVKPATSWVDDVAELLRQSGGDIGIHGSIALASSLWRAGLIDVLELVVAPAIAAHGRRMFDGGDPIQTLSLAAADRSPVGTLFLTYRRGSAS